jgi:hypothetical protein
MSIRREPIYLLFTIADNTAENYPCEGAPIVHSKGSFMRFALALPILLALSNAAYAEPIDDLSKAQQDIFDAWVKVPLTEQKVAFITEPSAGYGMYTERGTNIFKQGEPLITYVEPIGYGWKELPGDMFEINFVADVMLTAENGSVIADEKGFAKVAFQSHNAAMELKLDLTLNPTGLPVGKYKLTYTLHDMSADQVSTFDQPIEIVAGS